MLKKGYLRPYRPTAVKVLPDPEIKSLAEVVKPWDGESEVDVGILGIPSDDGTVSHRRGSRFAPSRVREVLYSKTTFSSDHSVEFDRDLVDLGDVETLVGDFEGTHRRLAEVARYVYGKARHVVAIGGDHSLSLELIRAASSNAKRIALIQLDAHHDVRARWGRHSGYWLRELIEGGVVRGKDVYQFGIRGSLYSRELQSYVHSKGINVYTAWTIRESGIKDVLGGVLDRITDSGVDACYITCDIDGVDYAYAPGTDYPSPGGLTSWEALYIVYTISVNNNARWLDVMEVSPPHDLGDMTVRLAAEIISQFLFGLARR